MAMNEAEEDYGFHERVTQLVAGKPFEWAKKAGIPSSTWSRIWNERKIPTAPHLIKISRQAGVSIDWLLTGDEFFSPENGNADRRKAPAMARKEQPLNGPLLKEVILLVEDWLNDNRRAMPSAKKAEIVTEIYTMALEGEENKSPLNKERMGKILRLVS